MSDRYDGEFEEDKSNPFVNMLKTIFGTIWMVITLPFRLIWRLLKLMNEVRAVVLGLVTLIVIVIVGIILIFVFKPAFLWDPLKTFLNAEMAVPVYNEASDEYIYARINNGDLEIGASESELTLLFRKAGIINENSVVGLTDNNMTIYLNADTKDKPLWIFINAKEDGTGNVAVDKSGFGRFWLPEFMSNWISGGFNTVVDTLRRQNRSSSLVLVINQLLDSKRIPENIELKSVDIQDKQVILKFGLV